MHAVEPEADEYFPAEQLVQETERPPTTFVCLPASQAVQLPDSATLYCPALQSAQDVSKLVALSALLYFPETQDVQELCPATVVTLPVVQSIHALEPVSDAYFPIAQFAHVTVAVDAAYVPTAQLVHAVAASPEYVPRAQETH